MTLIAGALLLLLGLYALKLWTKASPKALATALYKIAGYLMLGGAAVSLVTGRFAAAVPLAMLGAGLLAQVNGGGIGGWLSNLFGQGGFARRRAARVSRVSSPMFEMELNHDTGVLSGRVTTGPRAGTSLDDLEVPDLLALRGGLDAQSLALIEAYLDRRAPAWREHAQSNAGGRSGEGSSMSARNSAMTEEEAHQILGLEPGAGEAAVRAAHRALMKKLHPDHGGSSYLAARVNQAKDVILDKHL
ncbi:J domain-containing protein [Roseixanthobacter pseudopolyaromaticivorans]|uniref:molecular chaperone DnaJ n=1 Tax=Xanthobacteraceae TaxID=335928 RepID=UPI00372C41C3